MIVLAGATGDLGLRIANAILDRGGKVRALVRSGSAGVKGLEALTARGASTATVDYTRHESLVAACRGASCVVSALSGLREVVVDAQTALLDAAVAAHVPRFIPSDYALDFTKLAPGTNRNLDLRREFRERLDRAKIAPTSILNGAFADMLTGQAPLVLFKFKRVLYWGDADVKMDFTTKDDVAAFTAGAALDASTPRWLRIAGDSVSARDLAREASLATGDTFRLVRGGSLRTLSILIRVARALARKSAQRGDLYPPWQGMQYLRNMFSGAGILTPLDNDRYPEITWSKVGSVLRLGADA